MTWVEGRWPPAPEGSALPGRPCTGPREQDVADILGIPYDTVAQAVQTPLAYSRGTKFKPAARPDPDVVIHWDDW